MIGATKAPHQQTATKGRTTNSNVHQIATIDDIEVDNQELAGVEVVNEVSAIINDLQSIPRTSTGGPHFHGS